MSASPSCSRRFITHATDVLKASASYSCRTGKEYEWHESGRIVLHADWYNSAPSNAVVFLLLRNLNDKGFGAHLNTTGKHLPDTAPLTTRITIWKEGLAKIVADPTGLYPPDLTFREIVMLSAILSFNPEPGKYSHIGIEEFTLDHTLQTEKITLSYAKSI